MRIICKLNFLSQDKCTLNSNTTQIQHILYILVIECSKTDYPPEKEDPSLVSYNLRPRLPYIFQRLFLNFSGTHKRQFEGMPATNKPVTIRSADLYIIENDKIVEHWDVVDQLDLLKQTNMISFNQPHAK